jgi:hypothetical protein
MGWVVFIATFLGIPLLSLRYGVDSRIRDERDRRGWWV